MKSFLQIMNAVRLNNLRVSYLFPVIFSIYFLKGKANLLWSEENVFFLYQITIKLKVFRHVYFLARDFFFQIYFDQRIMSISCIKIKAFQARVYFFAREKKSLFQSPLPKRKRKFCGEKHVAYFRLAHCTGSRNVLTHNVKRVF